MRDRFGATDERSLKLRFHAQTAGCSLTWQQPENNIVRTSIQAMAAVLGGCQSLHTNSLDEAYALPSEHAVTIALRTQQVIAHETGVTAEPDPFGGSEYVERLTTEIEAAALDYIRRIDGMGGMVAAIERGFPQAAIAQASYGFQKSVESGESVIVGVNRFQQVEEKAIDVLRIDAAAEQKQRERLAGVKRERDGLAVEEALQRLKRGAEGSENTMPLLLDAVRAYATVGEMCAVLKEVFGAYTETNVL
jgi:methylmalonyl-CoA mutase N-terminal domain/subunit